MGKGNVREMRKKRILEEVEAELDYRKGNLDYRKGNIDHIEEISRPEEIEKNIEWLRGAIAILEWVKEMLEK